jgi:Domain of unknown function (DUF397)
MEDTDLKWRTSSYSSNGGGNCVEVVGDMRSVLVRDTKDRTGAVLWFTPAAWRRFADLVKRSLACMTLVRVTDTCRGHSRVLGVPLRCVRWFPRGRGRGLCRGVGGPRAGFLQRRGRCGMRVDCGARSAPLGWEKGGRGSGGTGETRALGGFPGFPWHHAGFQVRQVRCGMRGRLCTFPVMKAKGW